MNYSVLNALEVSLEALKLMADYESQETGEAYKAADEPGAAAHGGPLPEGESEEDWEITESDIEKAQQWVDGAIKELGLG